MSKWPSLNTSRSISSLSDRAAARSLSSGRDTDEALEGHGGGVHQTYCCLHHRLPSRVRVGGEEVKEKDAFKVNVVGSRRSVRTY